MRVAKFSGDGVKGRAFSHDVAPVHLFCGRNSAGKTARLNALQLALAGFLPGYPRRPGELLDALGGGRQLDVSVEMDNTNGITRTWVRGGNGLCSTCVGTSGLPGDWAVPPVAVDPDEWLGLSAKGRVAYLFTRTVAKDGVGARKKVMARVETAAGGDAEVVGVFKDIRRDTFQEWLEEACVAAKESRLACQQSARRLRETVAGLAQVRETGLEYATRVTMERNLESARLAIETLSAVPAVLKGRIEEAKEAVAKAAKAKDDLLSLAEEEVDALAKAIAEHEAARPDYSRDDHFAAQQHFNGLVDARHAVLKRHTKAAHAHGEVDAAHRAARGGTKCRTCGHVTKRDDAKVTELTPKLDAANAALAKEACAVADVEKAVKEARTQLSLHAEANDKYNKWMDGRASLLKRKDQMAAKSSMVTDLRALAQTLPDAVAHLKEQERQLEAAEKVLEEGREKLREREAEKAAADRRAGEVAAQAKAVAQAEEAERQVETFKTVEAELLSAQREAVAGAVGPLFEAANRLCEGLLPGQLALVDGGLVMETREGTVRHVAFGGAEKTLSYCALSVALAAQEAGDGPRVAFVDEVTRLDEAKMAKFVERLCVLVQVGQLDNTVLTGTSPFDGHLGPWSAVFRQEEIR